MWLVNWLLDQWDKLNLLFVTLWGEVVNFASYGFARFQTWVKSWIDWLNSLITYYAGVASTALANAENWLAGLIQGARDAASSALASARDWLYGLIYDLARAVDTTITNVRDWLLGIIEGVRSAVATGLAAVSSWINASLTALNNWINSLYNQLLGALAGLRGWIDGNILIPLLGLASTLATFRSTWEPLLVGLFSSPGRFIFGFIETYAYSWVEWFLASLLGGVDIPAPVKLDFFHSDPGGPMYTPSGTLIPDPYYTQPLREPYSIAHLFTRFEPYVIFRAEPNDPVSSMAEGRVINTGYDPSGLGYHLTIDFGEGFTARYAYLDILFVGKGDRVEQLQPVGTAGNSGASPGISLRLELFYQGSPIDPLKYINY